MVCSVRLVCLVFYLVARGACNFMLLEALNAYVPQCVHVLLNVFITCSMCSSHAALGVHVFTTSVTQCACCSMCCLISVTWYT